MPVLKAAAGEEEVEIGLLLSTKGAFLAWGTRPWRAQHPVDHTHPGCLGLPSDGGLGQVSEGAHKALLLHSELKTGFAEMLEVAGREGERVARLH